MLSVLDEIKSKLDIVDVVSGYVRLQKAGANYKAPCPFHREKTPSFFVSTEKQIWHCFGCSKGGDIFAFIKEAESVDFPDALRILAKRAGVELKKENIELRTKRAVIEEICHKTVDFFAVNLKNAEIINKYLTVERALKPEIISEFKIGWALDDFRALTRYLASFKYSMADAEAAGVVIKSAKRPGDFFDRFRSRVMFPICDHLGKVIGFTGRVFQMPGGSKTLHKDEGKYVNTPQTMLFDKSMVLYGLDKAKQAIKEVGYCVLVEGQMDFLALYQEEIKNVVATSGTALTPKHLKILRRYTDNLYLFFDNDEAGVMATERTIDLALNEEFNVKVIKMPNEGKDAADYVKAHPGGIKKYIESAEPVMDFYFNRAFSLHDASKIEGKKKAGDYLLKKIYSLQNKIEQEYYLKELSKKIGISEATLKSALEKIKPDSEISYQYREEKEVKLITDKFKTIEENILGLILKFRQWDFIDKICPDCFSDTYAKELLSEIKKGDYKNFDVEKFKETATKELKEYIDFLVFKIEAQFDHFLKLDGTKAIRHVVEEIEFGIREIEINGRQAEISRLKIELDKAEKAKDTEKVREIMGEIKKHQVIS